MESQEAEEIGHRTKRDGGKETILRDWIIVNRRDGVQILKEMGVQKLKEMGYSEQKTGIC